MVRGWQEGKRGTWQKWGTQALGMEGCAGAGGTRADAIHTTGHVAIRTKIKAIYQEVGAARLPSVHSSGGVRICTPQSPSCTFELSMAWGISMGDPEP